MSRVIGIDPSLSCTALVSLPQGEAMRVQTSAEEWPVHPERLAHIRDEVRGFCFPRRPQLVLLEGYNYGARNGRETAGEVGGVIRVALWEAGLSYAVVAPKTLKAFVTSGKADKAEMMAAVRQRWGIEPRDDNEADAYGLTRLAEQLCLPRARWSKRFAQLARRVQIVEGQRPDGDLLGVAS